MKKNYKVIVKNHIDYNETIIWEGTSKEYGEWVLKNKKELFDQYPDWGFEVEMIES